MFNTQQQSWRQGQRVNRCSRFTRGSARVRGLVTGTIAFLDRGESGCAPAKRIKVLATGIFLIACGVTYRLYDLQEKEFPRWSEIASKQHLASVKVHGARGTIYDSQGRVLAVSIKSLSIAAHPHLVRNPRELAHELGPLLPLGEKEILNRLSSGKKFVWLSHGVPMSAEEHVRELMTTGVSALEEFTRVYPQGATAGPILGTVGRDGAGLSGVERQFNALLSAKDMNVPVRRDARGKLMNAVNFVSDAEALEERSENAGETEKNIREEGQSLTMSIDSYIQGIVEEELKRGATETKAQRAFSLVMDAETGEILALAQTGEFNPNDSEKVSPDHLRNTILQDSFEPGSTIKPLVAAVALDKKLIRADEPMNCESGSFRIGKHLIRDAHPVGEVIFPDVLIRSSNICMAKIGQRLGKAALADALQRFGFGDTTGIELPGESTGILRKIDKWADIDVATHAFGQGVSVTALQLVQAYSALANEGLMVRPTLLKRDPRAPISRARLVSAKTANTIAGILRGVTESEHGTAQKAVIEGFHVSGKTGTAQKARPKGRGYDENKVLGSFVGFVDGHEKGIDRKLIMFVAVDEPGVVPRWGGVVAGPIFQRAMERILGHLMTNSSEA